MADAAAHSSTPTVSDRLRRLPFHHCSSSFLYHFSISSFSFSWIRASLKKFFNFALLWSLIIMMKLRFWSMPFLIILINLTRIYNGIYSQLSFSMLFSCLTACLDYPHSLILPLCRFWCATLIFGMVWFRKFLFLLFFFKEMSNWRTFECLIAGSVVAKILVVKVVKLKISTSSCF